MIIDITKIKLTPGNGGIDCPGNGNHLDENGCAIECCCDECDYLLCCESKNFPEICLSCLDSDCPQNAKLPNSNEQNKKTSAQTRKSLHIEIKENLLKFW